MIAVTVEIVSINELSINERLKMIMTITCQIVGHVLEFVHVRLYPLHQQ